MASPLILVYNNQDRQMFRAHRACADANPLQYAPVVGLNPKYDFGNHRCGICGERLQQPRSLPASSGAQERRPLVHAAHRAPARDDVVWARKGTAGTVSVVAHRQCAARRDYRIIFEWSKQNTPYRGQPHCSVCGDEFPRSGSG